MGGPLGTEICENIKNLYISKINYIYIYIVVFSISPNLIRKGLDFYPLLAARMICLSIIYVTL